MRLREQGDSVRVAGSWLRIGELEQLRERGIDQLQEIDHGWCRSIYLLDPNGIMVEFCVTTDSEAFAQTEDEALRLLREPPDSIPAASAKELSEATSA